MRTARDEAFHDFVVRHRGDLLRTATMLAAGDTHLAEDLVQIALTRLYLAWHGVRAPQARLAYARRILVNTLVDESRRPWRRRERSHGELPDVPADHAHTETDDRLGRVGAALAELPPRMRAAVVFRYLHELSVAETADVLNCSQGTVKSQTARALEHLRRALGAAPVPDATPDRAGPVPVDDNRTASTCGRNR
ncbi:SigE family RNA polymerase sigma factor [Blastococcus sp. SYSU DS1021]